MVSIAQIIISTFCAVVSAFMMVIVFIYGKKARLTYKYIAALSIFFIHSSGQIIESILTINLTWLYANNKLHWLNYVQYYKFIAIFFTAPMWLLFIFEFAGTTLNRFERYIKKYLWIFFAIGIICYIGLFTNSWSKVIFSVHQVNGIWHTFFSKPLIIKLMIDFMCHLFCLYIVIRHISIKYCYYKKQAVLLNLLAFVPGILNYIYLFSTLYQYTHNFDITPLADLITMFLHLLFIKYRFLNMFPIPFTKMMDKVNESIIFIDSEGIILYFNQAFEVNFKSFYDSEKDQKAINFIDFLNNDAHLTPDKSIIINALKSPHNDEVTGELVIDCTRKHFSVNIQPLYDKKDLIGKIVTFYDVTDYRELAVTKERNRLAGEIHDSIGHTMTILISLLGVCSLASEKNDHDTIKLKLGEMMKVALDGHRELKNSVQGIMPTNQDASSISKSILSLVNDFEVTGVKVNVSIDGLEPINSSAYRKIIRKICREALTNSLRHGKASIIEILLRFTEKNIALYIFDDGIGCKDIKKNIGLHSMEEQVMELGGRIMFGSDGERGFNINVLLPVLYL